MFGYDTHDLHEGGLFREPDFDRPGWNDPLRADRDPTASTATNRRPRRSELEGIRRRSRLGAFFAAYGWRAYAVPILLVVTVLVAVNAVRSPGGDGGDGNTPGLGARESSISGIVGTPKGDGHFDASVESAALPVGGPFTETGKDTFHVVPGAGGQVGKGAEHVFAYTVDVEDGVDTVGSGGDEAFAQMVDQTLANPKSWIRDEKVGFRRVDNPDEADFHVTLTSQMTVRQDCGYTIPVESSCYNADIKRVILNEPRWVRGAVSYQGDIGSYRQYMINHEVGHAIGYAQHQPCESDGGLAPVMMQQTFGTANNDIARLDPDGVVPMNGLVCKPNAWPYPRG